MGSIVFFRKHIDGSQYIIYHIYVRQYISEGIGKMKNEEFVKASKALSDATRVRILQIVSKAGTICACKVLEELCITQGTLSHHMKVLTDLRLVSVEKTGKWCNYTLIRENICEIAHFIQDICIDKEAKSSSCGCK